MPYLVNLTTATSQGYVWPASGTRINPNLGQIAGVLWNADSIYHSLQVQLTRQLRKGVQAGLSYAWAKSIDTGSTAAFSDNFVNSVQRLYFDPKQGRGLSDFDIRHNFTFNYIWELPGPKSGPSALRWVAGGGIF